MAIPHLQDSSLRLTDCIFFGDSIAEAAFSGIILDGSVTLAKLAPEVTAVAIGGAAASHTHAATDITSGTLPVEMGGTGVSAWPGPNETGARGALVYTTGRSTALTSSPKLYATPEVGYAADDVGLFLNHRRYAWGNMAPSAPLHVVTHTGAGGDPSSRTVAMLGAAANLSIYGQRRTVSVAIGHASDESETQGQVLPQFSALLSYSWDHPVWTTDPPASPYTQEFTIGVPTALGHPTTILGCKGDGTVNAYHGLNVFDGKLSVEAKKGLIDTGDCAVQVTSQVVAGAGERAAVYLQGLGTGGYAAFKMGCNAKSSEFLVSVGNTIDGFEVRDTNAAATRLSIDNSTGDIRLLGNTFVGTTPAAPPRSRLEVTQKLTSIDVGYGAAFRVNSGAEPDYGTPGADTNIAGQFFSNNASMTNASLWGLNVVVGQGGAPIPAPTPPAGGIHIVGAEIEVFNRSDAGNAELRPVDPYASPDQIRANGIEIIGHSGSTYRNAGALVTWANDATGGKWWDTGLALSRCYSYGVRFHRITGDSVEPFQSAMLDASELTTAIQPLILARSSGDVRYDIKNDADYSVYLNIDSGDAAAAETALLFGDRGSRKWLIGKDSSNHLQIGWNDGANAFSAISAYIDDEGTPTEALLSFYGAAPAAKPTVTGSKGGNAALASLLTALATLGLITDSTT